MGTESHSCNWDADISNQIMAFHTRRGVANFASLRLVRPVPYHHPHAWSVHDPSLLGRSFPSLWQMAGLRRENNGRVGCVQSRLQLVLAIAVEQIQLGKVSHLHVFPPHKTGVSVGGLEVVGLLAAARVGGAAVGLSNRLVKGHPYPLRVLPVVQLGDDAHKGDRPPPGSRMDLAAVAYGHSGDGGRAKAGSFRRVLFLRAARR
mmetsp:Transcript_12090/g.34632  ORF Transcript_12090/g.34632 Transcript_12090/m.34632 type:complete len:204 (+) Transcript_12090:996-1607(+)